MKHKFQKAIDAIISHQIRGICYLTGSNGDDCMRKPDITKPCCAIGSMVVAEPQMHKWIDFLYENNTSGIGRIFNLEPGIKEAFDNLYNMGELDLMRLQEINDGVHLSPNDRKAALISFLEKLT